MAMLELVAPTPDWASAVGKALERPPGVPERRTRPREDAGPRRGAGDGRFHRRISDDLMWLREAVDQPGEHGFEPVSDTAAVAVWKADLEGDQGERLCNLRDRGVLDAAGFLLHESGT